MYTLTPATAGAASPADAGGTPASAPSSAQGGGTFAVNDGVRTAYPAALGDAAGMPAGAGGFLGLMQGMLAKISDMIASLGGGGSALGGNGADPAERSLASFTGSSTGDPHEALDATLSGGGSLAGKWDSMTSHRHFAQSDSFDGGYDVSTKVGAPDAHGVTTNTSATVALANGGTNVTMNRDGSYAVSRNGQALTLAAGEAVQLGGGASALLNGDGSLTVAAQNSAGGTLSTTMRSTGGGVDVSMSGSKVDLGGYLIDRTEDAPGADASPAAAQSATSGVSGLGYVAGADSLDPFSAPAAAPWSGVAGPS